MPKLVEIRVILGRVLNLDNTALFAGSSTGLRVRRSSIWQRFLTPMLPGYADTTLYPLTISGGITRISLKQAACRFEVKDLTLFSIREVTAHG